MGKKSQLAWLKWSHNPTNEKKREQKLQQLEFKGHGKTTICFGMYLIRLACTTFVQQKPTSSLAVLFSPRRLAYFHSTSLLRASSVERNYYSTCTTSQSSSRRYLRVNHSTIRSRLPYWQANRLCISARFEASPLGSVRRSCSLLIINNNNYYYYYCICILCLYKFGSLTNTFVITEISAIM